MTHPLISCSMLWENADNVHLDIFVSQMLFVLSSEDCEEEYWHRPVDHMVEFAAHFPRGNLSRIRLWLEVISSSVEPMSIPINMELIEVFELVERVVLQVVVLDLVVLSNLWFVFESSLVGNGDTLVISWLRRALHGSCGEHLSVEHGSSQLQNWFHF